MSNSPCPEDPLIEFPELEHEKIHILLKIWSMIKELFKKKTSSYTEI